MVDLNIDIISLNTASLGDFTKRQKIFNYIKKQVSCKGVVFLKETHNVQKDEKIWTNKFGCGQDSIVFPMSSQMLEGSLLPFEIELSTRLEPSM